MSEPVAFPKLTRVGLAILAVVSAEVGIWAAFSPASFYEHFPGAGHVWVAVDGAYNEHLVRDVGNWNLAFAVLFVVAAVWLERHVVWAALLAYLPQAALHLSYHLRHLNLYGTTDKIGNVTSLVLGLAIPVALLAADTIEARRRSLAAI
jgi:hypothetical protein